MSILELDCYSRYLTPTVVQGSIERPVALNSAHHMELLYIHLCIVAHI